VVEPAIALSIIYVGADNLMVHGGRDVRAWIAFAFGLIHGFGFANVLRDMDLPSRALGWSLFSFGARRPARAQRNRRAAARGRRLDRRHRGRSVLVHSTCLLSRGDGMRSVSLLALAVSVAIAGWDQPAAAQLGTRTAEEWIKTLDSPNRLQGLKISEVVAALTLKPGMAVADIGAGTGVFSLPLARAVRPGGKMYAVEVDQKLLEHVLELGTEQGVTNIEPVFAEFDDPLLPPGVVDLAFIHDVLHHIEKREVYLKNLAGYLKPGGRIAVIDFKPGVGGHRDDAKMQLGQEQVTAMMAAVGMKPAEEVKLFEDKWFIIFAKQ
jgi:ubiquinone/menaquinone biosynthesis C-methylase UbiE